MADSTNRGSGASLFGWERGTLPPRLDFSSSQRNRNGGSGATLFFDFSAFREMIRQGGEIAKVGARAERVAAREATRAEMDAARAENRRLMEEAFELKLKLLGLKEKQSSGVTGGQPRATGSGGESGRPNEGAVQGSAATVSGRVPYLNDTNKPNRYNQNRVGKTVTAELCRS